MRRRLNLSIDEELHDEICGRSMEYGFRSPCSFAATAVRVLLGLIRARREGELPYAPMPDAADDNGGEGDGEFLREMFGAYEDWQLDPEHKARQGLRER